MQDYGSNREESVHRVPAQNDVPLLGHDVLGHHKSEDVVECLLGRDFATLLAHDDGQVASVIYSLHGTGGLDGVQSSGNGIGELDVEGGLAGNGNVLFIAIIHIIAIDGYDLAGTLDRRKQLKVHGLDILDLHVLNTVQQVVHGVALLDKVLHVGRGAGETGELDHLAAVIGDHGQALERFVGTAILHKPALGIVLPTLHRWRRGWC